MSSVLDASALLAGLKEEPGAERVRAALIQGAFMSTVNLAEVATRLRLAGADEGSLRRLAAMHPVQLVPYDQDLAIRTALMATLTLSSGLSLGDRACLALAKRLGLPALTSDRKWAEVAAAIGVTVELIR